MPGCSVPHCHRRAEKGFRLFVFPKDHERRRLWTQLCNRQDKPPPKHARMCEYHFEKDQFDIDRSGRKGKLKPNAIPTIFDTPLTLRQVYVSIRNKKKEELMKMNRKEEDILVDHNFDYIKPEFVDVSQHDDDSFWKNEFDVNNLEHSFEENSFQETDHQQENFDLMEEDFNSNENLEVSNASVEQLCVEPEFTADNFKNTIDSEDIIKSESGETMMDITKILEEQLREKDNELIKTKRLLSKTLEHVERLKALNEKLQIQISESSNQSKTKYYSRLRKRIKREKCTE